MTPLIVWVEFVNLECHLSLKCGKAQKWAGSCAFWDVLGAAVRTDTDLMLVSSAAAAHRYFPTLWRWWIPTDCTSAPSSAVFALSLKPVLLFTVCCFLVHIWSQRHKMPMFVVLYISQALLKFYWHPLLALPVCSYSSSSSQECHWHWWCVPMGKSQSIICVPIFS